MRGRCACGVRLDLARGSEHDECRGEPPPQPKPAKPLTFRQRVGRWERMTPEQRQAALQNGWASQASAEAQETEEL